MRDRILRTALALIFLSTFGFTQTYTFSTLVNFTGADQGPGFPSNLIIDSSGNLYGTSYLGGKYGKGTVFKVTPAGKVSVLHSFAGQPSDGASPYDALARDKSGNLYGTTYSGGTVNTCSDGCGTVFKLTSAGKETILHNFTNGSDGGLPGGTVTLDSAGDIYGMAGFQVVFKIDTAGNFSTIYTFSDSEELGFGNTLIQNRAGDLFGTGYNPDGSNGGIVFEVTPQGKETTLYTFTFGGIDGSEPNNKLAQDAAGNLYGSTFGGGTNDEGTIFKIDTSGVLSVLYSFCQLAKCADGAEPYSWLTLDSSGNLYGETFNSGNVGLIFKLTPSGTESVLYSGITGNQAAQSPALVIDKSGNIYGSTWGLNNRGTIFKLTKN
jgi:uncharacterized repeat protein (TIGR03803 family)